MEETMKSLNDKNYQIPWKCAICSDITPLSNEEIEFLCNLKDESEEKNNGND
jgi:hypothetical protein